MLRAVDEGEHVGALVRADMVVRRPVLELTLFWRSSLRAVGVNTFINPNPPPTKTTLTLIRGTEDEKQSQLKRRREFQARNAAVAPMWLKKLQDAARKDENAFAVLMDAARYCSLGQITQALFEVGGQYRRNM